MQTSQTDFLDWVRKQQEAIETRLDALLPAENLPPQRLHAAMRYSVLGGGKRVRPLLAFASGELVEAPIERVAMAAAAVELIHVYSLVHDDLPCMDDDTLRRGKPTCHIQFDEATALLVGDSLQSLAFQLVSTGILTPDPATQIEMVRLLAVSSGSLGMAGGQAIDLASVGKQLALPELEAMHLYKTGALIKAAILLGASCGHPLQTAQRENLERFANRIGLAFQVVDDILDSESTTATLGKTAGKDAQNNKPTYVTLLGIDHAREFAETLRREALQALEIFGDVRKRLSQLADFIVARKS